MSKFRYGRSTPSTQGTSSPSPTSASTPTVISDLLGLHRDRAGGAFLHADAAALAEVQIDLVLVGAARFELDHRVVGADAVAVVAREAVAARHAASCLEQRVGLVEAADDLLERGAPARDVQPRAHGLRRVAVVPGVELVERRELVLGLVLAQRAAQVGVD